MDVLLIYPHSEGSEIEESQKVPPLGLAYIASVLLNEGISVRILDLHAKPLPDEKIEKILKKFKPKIVGMTVLTPFVKRVKELAKLTKKTVPNSKIVVGGAHVTAMPEQMLRDKNIDIAVMGEGELTFKSLVELYLKKKGSLSEVSGICYMDGKKFKRNPIREYIQNLDDLPFPARHLLPNSEYSIPHSNAKRITSILTMRGCPYNCNFCDYKFLMGHKLRMRSAKNVADEIEECINKYDIHYFNFRDSTFALSEHFVVSICDEIIKRKLKIRWDANGRANTVTLKMLKKMKKAGCVLVSYGVESGSQELLDFMNKRTTIQQNIDAIKMTKKAGINILAYFMFGNPPDTKETVEQTIDFAIKLNPDFALFGVTTPFPGTPLFDYCIKNKIISVKKDDDYSFLSLYKNPKSLSKHLTTEDLDHYLKKAYRKFYLRPRYILMKLFKIRSFYDIKKLFEGFFIFISQISNPKE